MERRIWFERKFDLGIPVVAAPEIMERLRGTPLRLEERTAAVHMTSLKQRVEGRWSIQEHVGHLLDLELLWAGRLDDFEMGAETLRPADVENRATWDGDHNARSLGDLLEEFGGFRSRFLERSEAMGVGELARTALHPRLGQPMTVVDLLFFVAEHDDHHLASITALARRMT
jgi:uncharacterized damage-inducible protein DinB